MIDQLHSRTIICSVLILMINIPAGLSQHYTGLPYIENFTTKEYNAGIQNYAMVQDQRGIIYVANNYGLLEFDGTKWTTYGVSNGTKVRSLAIDANGKIFVGAQDQFGYFYPNNRGQQEYHSISDMLLTKNQKVGEVWKTFIIESKVYFCTFNHIYVYDGNDIIIIGDNQSFGFAFKVNNEIIVQSIEVGLLRISNNTLVTLPGSEFFNDKNITTILPYTKDQLLVTSQNDGIFIFDQTNIEIWSKQLQEHVQNVFINTAIQLSDGRIAIGTSNNGLYIVENKGKIAYQINKDRGLQNRTVLSLLEDEYGNLWAGLNNGLSKVEYSSPFTFINENAGLQGTGYCSYLDDKDLYLGTNNGLFKSSIGISAFEQELEFTLNTNGQVYSIDSHQGNILIGHHEGGKILRNGKAFNLSGQQGSWRFMIPKHNPKILLEGTYNGFQVFQKSINKWTNPTSWADFNESTRVFEEEEDGTIWMTHGYKGVYRITPFKDYLSIKEIKFYDQNNGFTTNQLISVYRINGKLIFCTGQGVYSYFPSTDSFKLNQRYTDLFGPNIRISALKEDLMGNVYYISADSSGVLIKDRFGNYNSHSKIFNKIHQLLNDDLQNIQPLGFEHVLFGAKEGFIHYDSKKQTKLLAPINVLIRKVIATNNDSLVFNGNFKNENKIIAHQEQNHNPTYEFDNNSLAFSFSCTFSDELVPTKYSYKLEGYDENWSEWNHKSEKEYTNLREGKYRFLVKAKNLYDTESSVTEYKFSILPPWYRTKLSLFGLFLSVMGLIGGILFSQSSRHKKEKRHLTLQNERELIQKDKKLHEFSKKTEAEIITLRNEKLALEVNTKNKELASSTMNLINKNKFLSELKDNLDHVVTDGKSGSAKKLRDMMKRIDKNMAGDSEWEHFQNHFDQVHGDFSQRLIQVYPKLSPQDMKLSTYLRMNLSTKEIAQLLNITIRGAEIARYRLRKKLELNREDNLTEFILGF